MALPERIDVVRPDDHVVLRVFPENLKLQAVTPGRNQPSPFLMVPAGTGQPRLRVDFGAQQIIEYATPVTAARVRQPMPIYSPPTVVVVLVPANDPGIPLSVAGILAALDRLPLHVAEQGATRFALPQLLALRPHQTTTELDHLSQPARRADRTELWHSTVRPVTPTPGEPGIEVLLDAVAQQPRTPDNAAVVTDGAIRNVYTLAEWAGLAAKTQPAGAAPIPAVVERLRLSALGGWLDLRGSWPDVPEFGYHVQQGRDSAQRKVVRGSLYPFGHQALLTTDTTREFEITGNAGNPTGRAAALSTISTIQVIQPTVGFEYDLQAKANLGWPYASVTITDLLTPQGDAEPVSGLLGARALFVRGQRPQPNQPPAKVLYAFSCTAIDRAGQTSTFAMPMLFVPADVTDTAAIATAYNALVGLDPTFTGIPLAGQPLGVAPETIGAAAAARADGSSAERSTTVLASRLGLQLDAAARPVMTEVSGRVNALDRYAPGIGEVRLAYAQPYLDSLFGGANAQGQLFLQLVEEQTVGLKEKVTAGLAQLDLPVAGLSREFGALAASRKNLDPLAPSFEQQLANLAAGEIDLSFLDAVNTLLGIVPLKKLIPTTPKLELGKHQKITTTVVNGVATTELVFEVPLLRAPQGADQPFRDGFVGLAPFRRQPTDEHDTLLRVHQTTTLDTATGKAASTSVVTISSLALQLFATTEQPDPNDPDDERATPLVTLPLVSITFTSIDGDKPEVDVDLGPIRFGGFLAFLGVLAELVDQQGFTDPPALAVDETGITSSFSLDIPAVAVGMFALENLAFVTSLKLPFTDDPLALNLSFSRRDNPFIVTVAMLGGGGYLEIELTTGGIQRIAGALEFGARLSIDLVIAKASVEAMGGVYANYVKGAGIELIAYFRIRGELEVLSLVSVSVTFTLALEYRSKGNELFGRGEIAVNVTVVFFSETVVVPFERRFAGRNADPTFAELMAPPTPAGQPLPWDDYCLAFAA